MLRIYFCDQKGSVRPKEVVLKLAATKSAATGGDPLLSCQFEPDQSHKRWMLMKLLSCIKDLVRQGCHFVSIIKIHVEYALRDIYMCVFHLPLLNAQD